MANTLIHPSSIISENAIIAPGVKIGPFCTIGADVTLGEGCILHSHVVIDGYTTIGKNNEFYPFTSIGVAPQDKSYKGEATKTIIGDHNTFREMVQVHRGTIGDINETRIGSGNFFMTNTHIAHDCVIGNNITLASYCGLSGHVNVQDFAVLGGNSGAVQFVTVGKSAFIGGASVLDKDVPPYCIAYGNRVKLKGINIIGLKRQNIPRDTIHETVDFFKDLKSSSVSPSVFVRDKSLIKEYGGNFLITDIINFINNSKIGIPPFIS